MGNIMEYILGNEQMNQKVKGLALKSFNEECANNERRTRKNYINNNDKKAIKTSNNVRKHVTNKFSIYEEEDEKVIDDALEELEFITRKNLIENTFKDLYTFDSLKQDENFIVIYNRLLDIEFAKYSQNSLNVIEEAIKKLKEINDNKNNDLKFINDVDKKLEFDERKQKYQQEIKKALKKQTGKSMCQFCNARRHNILFSVLHPKFHMYQNRTIFHNYFNIENFGICILHACQRIIEHTLSYTARKDTTILNWMIIYFKNIFTKNYLKEKKFTF